MRFLKTAFSVILICICLCACEPYEEPIKRQLGIDPADFIIVEEQDTHGGLLGDGDYYMILDCSQNQGAALAIVQGWKPLPLSEYLQAIMYGGTVGKVTYCHEFAKAARWPVIQNGVYTFLDRHAEAKDPADETAFLHRYSFNFSIAAYDFDTDTLYYFEYDS